jgi:hypothetical protein
VPAHAKLYIAPAESMTALRSRWQRRQRLNRAHLAVTCSGKVHRVKRSGWHVCGRDGLEDGGMVVTQFAKKLTVALEMAQQSGAERGGCE